MLNELQAGGDWLAHRVGADNLDTPWIHYTDT